MKKILLIYVLSLLTLFVLANKPHIDHVNIDVGNSEIKWKGSKVYKSHDGVINIKKGTLLVDHGKLVGGEFSIDMRSIVCTDIEDEKKSNSLVKHLMDEDFFDVDNFPTASIKIIQAVKQAQGNYIVLAHLTIKGITHPIKFSADVRLKGKDITARAKIVIDRTKWGIEYGSGNIFKELGDKAILDEIEFSVLLVSEKL